MTERIAPQITAMIITHDESPNIGRCLDRLKWIPQILLVDSGSTDDTLEIASRFPNIRVSQRAFTDFASQCNFGLSQIDTPWVLSLDADYLVTDELAREIMALEAGEQTSYVAGFHYCVYGRRLRGTLYPGRRVLYMRTKARYRNEGHGHRVEVDGPPGQLAAKIDHDDRKPLDRWVASQRLYAKKEAEFLLLSDKHSLGQVDRVRLMGWPAPFLVFIYALIWRGCIFDGWYGWFYAFQRLLAETMIALEIADYRLRSGLDPA